MAASSILPLQTTDGSVSLLSLFIVVFVVFAIYTCGFVLIRSIVLWYWKVDLGINVQEQQTALLIKQNHLLEHQNKLLADLKDKLGSDILDTDIAFKKHKKSASHSTLVS